MGRGRGNAQGRNGWAAMKTTVWRKVAGKRHGTMRGDHFAGSGKMVLLEHLEHAFAGSGKPIGLRIEGVRQYLNFAWRGSPVCVRTASA